MLNCRKQLYCFVIFLAKTVVQIGCWAAIVTWDMIPQKKSPKPQFAVLSRKISLCILFSDRVCNLVILCKFTFPNTIKYSCDWLQLEYCDVTQKLCQMFVCTIVFSVVCGRFIPCWCSSCKHYMLCAHCTHIDSISSVQLLLWFLENYQSYSSLCMHIL